MEAVIERVRRVAVVSDDDHCVPDCETTTTNDHMDPSQHDPNGLPWAGVAVSWAPVGGGGGELG